jgi:uncharacterized protein YdhG (YjbR/CyaY superfamily)
MAKTNYNSIDEYHQNFNAEVLTRMQTIRAIVHQTAPQVVEVISYQIPAFKIGKHFLVYYSTYSQHISLSSPWSKAFLAHFSTELIGRKISRAAIHFPHSEPLPTALIQKIIEFRKAEIEAAP